MGKLPRAEELVTGLGHGDLVSAAEQHGLGVRRGVVIIRCDEPDVDFVVRLADAHRLDGDETLADAVAVSDLRRRETGGVIDEFRLVFVDCLLGVVMYGVFPFCE